MNERIRELYTQVCMEQNLPFTLEHNGAYMLDAFADKFAELIVRECGRVYIQNQQDGVMTLTQDLLQHLGFGK